MVAVLVQPFRRGLPAAVRSRRGRVPRTEVEQQRPRPHVQLARLGRAVQVLRKQAGAGKSGEPAAWEPITGQEAVVASNPAALLDGQAVQIEPIEKAAQITGNR